MTALLPDLAIRSSLPELMDDPSCAEDLLLRTVRQFASINALVARYRTILKRYVLSCMEMEPQRTYHLVDMGAGGCDIDAWLLREARRRNLKLRITACDLDGRILRYARDTYGNVEGLTFRQTDLLSDQPDEPVDFVFANHFLHHLDETQIIRLLQHWQPLVRNGLVFSDLARSRFAYAGYGLLSGFYRGSFARYDGLLSIRRGFLREELESMARKAFGTAVLRVHHLAPGRLVLCIGGNPRLNRRESNK